MSFHEKVQKFTFVKIKKTWNKHPLTKNTSPSFHKYKEGLTKILFQ
jgi:hypothetical protein